MNKTFAVKNQGKIAYSSDGKYIGRICGYCANNKYLVILAVDVRDTNETWVWKKKVIQNYDVFLYNDLFQIGDYIYKDYKSLKMKK